MANIQCVHIVLNFTDFTVTNLFKKKQGVKKNYSILSSTKVMPHLAIFNASSSV